MIPRTMLIDYTKVYIHHMQRMLRAEPYDELLKIRKVFNLHTDRDAKVIGEAVGRLTFEMGGTTDDLPMMMEHMLKLWNKNWRMAQREINRRRSHAH